MKRLVDAAHERGLMVFLDVVYNHFGPEGNYLRLYAPEFFHPERKTPWGGAIAYEKPPVQALLCRNALYWLERVSYRRAAPRRHRPDRRPAEEPLLEELALEVRASAFPDATSI